VNAYAATHAGVRGRARRAPPRERDDHSVASAVAKFALTALAAVALIGVGGVVVIRHVARTEALREAKEFARVAGRGIAEPLVTPGVLRGDPRAIARLDRAVHARILGEGVVRVKIWDARGRIVYSDAPGLVGTRYHLGNDELEALRERGVYADASDLSRPENRFERSYHRLVEVYLSIRATNGTPLLFEDYERSASITAGSRRRLLTLAPGLIGALVLLELVLVPLAWSMARRLRDRQREREALLRHAIESSEVERRRVAADLHDGPLQRLASLSFDLSTEAELVAAHGPPGVDTALRAGARQTRETIRELRALLVDIYPPTLREEGLAAALSDVAAALTGDGVEVVVDVDPDAALPYETEALFFRVAQEALRNAKRHAGARSITVRVWRAEATARLVVADDGRGFAARDAAEGHFGMRLMEDLARGADGRLDVESAPGVGTRVTLEVPA
jgi:two-component system NarL family sensor kinase